MVFITLWGEFDIYSGIPTNTKHPGETILIRKGCTKKWKTLVFYQTGVSENKKTRQHFPFFSAPFPFPFCLFASVQDPYQRCNKSGFS